MPSLPPPTELAKLVAYTDEDRLKLGSSYLGSCNRKVAAEGSRGVYSPTWDSAASPSTDDLAYAVYAFNVEGYDLEPELYARWCTAPAADCVWIGFSRWEDDAWEFIASSGNSMYSPGAIDDYISVTGQFLAVVAVAGIDECILDCLRLGPLVGQWEVVTAQEDNTLRLSSLALDAGNKPHYACQTFSEYPYDDVWVTYSTFDGHAWSTEIVDEYSGFYDIEHDELSRVPYTIDLDVDSAGRPHVLYDNAVQEELIYVYRDGGTWSEFDLTGVYSGAYPDDHCARLALDSSDVPHIVHSDDEMIYAYLTGSSWHVEEVGTDIRTPSWHDLALSDGGTPQVAFMNRDTDRISWAGLIEDSWEFYSTPGVYESPTRVSMAVNHKGFAAITFWDLAAEQLGYVYEVKGIGWQSMVPDDEGNPGRDSSIAFDSRDHPHLSYSEAFNADMKYAYFDGTEWWTETIEGEGGVSSGGRNSIAIDSYDRPHIVFTGHVPPDGDVSVVRYARRID